jgi:hypothetical protein
MVVDARKSVLAGKSTRTLTMRRKAVSRMAKAASTDERPIEMERS